MSYITKRTNRYSRWCTQCSSQPCLLPRYKTLLLLISCIFNLVWYFTHTHTHTHIYIVIHRQIYFVLSELISVARHISFPSIRASNLQPRGASSSEVNFKRLWIPITIVYIHPFNGYRDLYSYMKRLVINANGNTITSFARELNPTGVGEYIYSERERETFPLSKYLSHCPPVQLRL